MPNINKQTAILAKEVGYNEACNKYYTSNGEEIVDSYFEDNTNTSLQFSYCAPTLNDVIDWLRIKHEIYITVCISDIEDLHKYFQVEAEYAYEDFINLIERKNNFETWEDAQEHGIAYALNYLKDKK